MLDLLRTYAGCPATGLQHLVLPRETLLLYPFSDSIIILNAHTLSFIRALAFWEAFPGLVDTQATINCLSIDPRLKLIVASMGPRVATWCLSGVENDTWRVHSSLLLDNHAQATALDCKSGLLAVGTPSSLSVYTLILENDLPTWSLKWTLPITRLSRVRFSPSLMYIASTSTHDNTVRIYLTTSGRQTQAIPHPRPVTDMNWRRSQASSRDDLILYTITLDATVRIFLPVLDTPQHVQLHAALDLYSALPFPVASKITSSSVFWLDREVMSIAFDSNLAEIKSDDEDARSRRIREIKEENWDLFLRVLADGSLVVQAVANIDRRPPTLLKQFTLLHTSPSSIPCPPAHLYVLPSSASPGNLSLVTSPPLASYTLNPLLFFNGQSEGLQKVTRLEEPHRTDDGASRIVRLVRTPDGEGVGALKVDGSVETWSMSHGGHALVRKAELKAATSEYRVDHLAVLASGNSFVTYSSSTQALTLHTSPPVTLDIPAIGSLFTLPTMDPSHWTLVGITTTYTVLLMHACLPSSSSPAAIPSLTLQSHTSLPLDQPPKMILPVDPMTWTGFYDARTTTRERDVLLSVSEEGELAFWAAEEDPFGTLWRCTGKVRTGRSGFSMARCSSAKKSALVAPGPEGEELTIWDSKESEFGSGLEYRYTLSASDPINDLDWTATPDNQSILAVGFAHRVELLSQQRMTYFDSTPGWSICWRIDLGKMIPHHIGDSIWLKRGTLLVGAGHIMCLYGQPKALQAKANPAQGLFESVARQNGPLDDYHPQMVLQCLLWEKIELVKKIIVNLAQNLARTKDIHTWEGVPLEEFLKDDGVAQTGQIRHGPQYSVLFSVPEIKEESDEDRFEPELVQRLIQRLEEDPLPHLTPNEHESLLALIQTTQEIELQRRALDSNGLRYLISMRIFYIYNRRLSSPSTPQTVGTKSTQIRPRQRIRYRDMIWAFHSESQDLLLSASEASCEGKKMCWPDARALGTFIWLRSIETMRTHMEVIARNQYMAGDNRDPTQCSLFYFALGKSKLVHGLWKQAAWHKEQAAMLKFLNNDFSQPRWRTAALKNAFALLSKRRFEYAAAFFLLGGSLKDAVSVCIKNLNDFQLAIALARVAEQGDEGPVLQDILNGTVIPTAFKEGNRWLASWAFWLLRRRDLAVRILITPLQDMADALDTGITDIGEPHYDDPSLALLFSQLKSKTLQAAKGTSEISGRTEYNFVLQIARVFCRMGCHALALDLVRSWSFERPSAVIREAHRPPSPITTRFALEPALRRQSSIFIDMEIASGPPTRAVSPIPIPANEMGVVTPSKEEGDLSARKAGIGSLMKSAKQDVTVPEFDMGAFF